MRRLPLLALVATLFVALTSGCRSKGEPLETSTNDPERVTKRLTVSAGGERVTSRNVVTLVKYTLRDRGNLKSHSDGVCMLAGILPGDIRHEEVAQITATKRTYGSTDEVLLAMADEGRRIGVEVIDGLQANQRFKGPLPWRVSSPVGVGRLVKIDPTNLPLDCEKLGGTTVVVEGAQAAARREPAAPSKTNVPTESSRLQKLEELKKNGLISEDEYRTRRQKILDGI